MGYHNQFKMTSLSIAKMPFCINLLKDKIKYLIIACSLTHSLNIYYFYYVPGTVLNNRNITYILPSVIYL